CSSWPSFLYKHQANRISVESFASLDESLGAAAPYSPPLWLAAPKSTLSPCAERVAIAREPAARQLARERDDHERVVRAVLVGDADIARAPKPEPRVVRGRAEHHAPRLAGRATPVEPRTHERR